MASVFLGVVRDIIMTEQPVRPVLPVIIPPIRVLPLVMLAQKGITSPISVRALVYHVLRERQLLKPVLQRSRVATFVRPDIFYKVAFAHLVRRVHMPFRVIQHAHFVPSENINDITVQLPVTIVLPVKLP